MTNWERDERESHEHMANFYLICFVKDNYHELALRGSTATAEYNKEDICTCMYFPKVYTKLQTHPI